MCDIIQHYLFLWSMYKTIKIDAKFRFWSIHGEKKGNGN
jgi:hypothetical protein